MVPVCVWCVCMGWHVQIPEDSFLESIFSFHFNVGSKDHQVIRLLKQALSHFTSPPPLSLNGGDNTCHGLLWRTSIRCWEKCLASSKKSPIVSWYCYCREWSKWPFVFLNIQTENVGEVLGNHVAMDNHFITLVFKSPGQGRDSEWECWECQIRILARTCFTYCVTLDYLSERYLLFSDLHFQNVKWPQKLSL